MHAHEEWLSLKEAATLLGVHPSTVRLWSDKGLLPVHRTQGGHRRYRRSEVLLWSATRHVDPPPDAAGLIQLAMRNIRFQISEGRLEGEGWYQRLDEAARAQYRQSAHTLFQGLLHYLSSQGEEAVSEAHSIGYEYASRAHRFGLSSLEATQAFLFFRDLLLKSVIQAYQEANVSSGQAWGEVLTRLHAFTDSILLQMLETHQAMEKASKV